MTDSPPLVSIIIPTYNAGPYIEEAVHSALAQTLRDIEVLVFDNASTDDTPQRLGRIGDARLRYRYCTENVGFCGNVSRGLRAARGRYLMVLGADDALEPDFLAEAVRRMEAEPTAQMLHGGAVWMDSDGVPTGRFEGRWPEKTDSAEAFMLCLEQGFCFSTVLCRGDAARALGAMPEAWGAISDSWLFLKLCCRGPVLFMAGEKARYRVHESSLSFQLYADGQMFRDHLRGVREALAWPEAAAAGAATPRRRRRALAAVGREALATLHLARLAGGRAVVWRQFREVLAAAPTLWRDPVVWLRFAFAMAPRGAISALRERRRARRAERMA